MPSIQNSTTLPIFKSPSTCDDQATNLLVALAPFGFFHAAGRVVRHGQFRDSCHVARNRFPRGFRCHVYTANCTVINKSIHCFPVPIKLFITQFNSFCVNVISCLL